VLKTRKELSTLPTKQEVMPVIQRQQTFTHPTADSMTNLHGRLHGFILQQGHKLSWQAESYVEFWSTEPQTDIMSYKWGHCWMTCATEHSFFWQGLQTSRYTRKHGRHLDYWTVGVDNSRIKYTPKVWHGLITGVLWDMPPPLRFLRLFMPIGKDAARKRQNIQRFCKGSGWLRTGSTGRSFVVGFGEIGHSILTTELPWFMVWQHECAWLP